MASPGFTSPGPSGSPGPLVPQLEAPPLPANRGHDAIKSECESSLEGTPVVVAEPNEPCSSADELSPSKSSRRVVSKWIRPMLLRHYPPLTSQSSWRTRLLYAVLCPIHGQIARVVTYLLLFVLIVLVSFCLLGHIGTPPNGTVFLLLVLVTLGALVGQAFTWVHLPPLLGMLITGIVLKNLPFIEFEDRWAVWSSTLRGVALVIILMRAGLGLDPEALKRLSALVFRLAFLPCLAETSVVAVASHFLLGFPWLWGFMLGFVLAAVSPAVVVPCLLQLQKEGYGVAKGIPTLVMAAASVDDVLAISGFTIVLGITFSPDASLVQLAFQGPLEAAIGVASGIVGGLVVIFLPHQAMDSYGLARFSLLVGGCLVCLFGSKLVHFPGAGALAVLVMSFVAGFGWRKQGWSDDNLVSKYLSHLWMIFQPLLFGLIGTEIKVGEIDQSTIGLGLAVVLISLTVRVIVSFLSVTDRKLNLRERVFIALAWIPKATVQAAIGPVAYDTALNLEPRRSDYIDLGHQLLTIAVLVILVTAPIGAIAIMTTAPRLLTKQGKPPSSA
ncbi:hypothetical protein TCAL_08307 [Tigriopus californicus]|uniref:Cation/H+ exchanger transmembrane domain-containing protein n=1 Tax=Tigriopus californicus TaxID=6832 RepID=A0A553PC57_TIGCA|nr:sodium/hydrogen exchanger 9B2-like [Tigriopus californicus]TRY75264.1 hypothetical protein TCAL_08307 [Tigriopus californicus]